jgi:hypothetical protein
MPLPFNPLIWKSLDFSQAGTMPVFLNQLGEDVAALASMSSNPATVGNTVSNGSKGGNLGVITASPTVDATGAVAMSVSFEVTGVLNPTLTITNLNAGTIVQVRFQNGAGSARTLKIAASGFTILGDVQGIAEFDFTASGISIGTPAVLNLMGITIGTSQLSFSGTFT